MNSTPVVELPQLFIPLSLSSEFFVPLLFLFVAAFYTIFTGILYFHWNAYSADMKVTSLTYVTYLIITLPLIAIMGISVFLI